MSSAIEVETSVKIDWYQLGRHLASQTSEDQIELLDGFANAMFDLSPAKMGLQLAFIATEPIGIHTAAVLADLLEAINSATEE